MIDAPDADHAPAANRAAATIICDLRVFILFVFVVAVLCALVSGPVLGGAVGRH